MTHSHNCFMEHLDYKIKTFRPCKQWWACAVRRNLKNNLTCYHAHQQAGHDCDQCTQDRQVEVGQRVPGVCQRWPYTNAWRRRLLQSSVILYFIHVHAMITTYDGGTVWSRLQWMISCSFFFLDLSFGQLNLGYIIQNICAQWLRMTHFGGWVRVTGLVQGAVVV